MPCPITRAALGRVAGGGLTGRQNIFCRSTRLRVLWMGIPFGGFRKSRRSFQEPRNTGSSEPSSNESDAFGGPAAIPITPDLISAHPIKSILMIGERRAGKDKREATIRVWDVRDHAIDHRVSPRDKTAVGSGRRADRRKERPARNSLGLLLRRTPMRKSRPPGNAQSPRVSESLHTTGVVI